MAPKAWWGEKLHIFARFLRYCSKWTVTCSGHPFRIIPNAISVLQKYPQADITKVFIFIWYNWQFNIRWEWPLKLSLIFYKVFNESVDMFWCLLLYPMRNALKKFQFIIINVLKLKMVVRTWLCSLQMKCLPLLNSWLQTPKEQSQLFQRWPKLGPTMKHKNKCGL